MHHRPTLGNFAHQLHLDPSMKRSPIDPYYIPPDPEIPPVPDPGANGTTQRGAAPFSGQYDHQDAAPPSRDDASGETPDGTIPLPPVHLPVQVPDWNFQLQPLMPDPFAR